MSTTVDIATVTHSIASLSISGVGVKDIHEMSDSFKASTPVLFPEPSGFITDVELVRNEMTGQLDTLSYTLHYRFLYCEMAGANAYFNSFAGFIAKVALILLAFSSDATLNGAMDNEAPAISEIGVVAKEDENIPFLGCAVSLKIKQFLEV